MARKTEKGGKFRNVHCRTWNMARKLKIMENEKHPLDDLKNDEITKNVINGPVLRRKIRRHHIHNARFIVHNQQFFTQQAIPPFFHYTTEISRKSQALQNFLPLLTFS